MKKVGLVLSGGAVRGLAHIGVLKALQEIGIKPTILSGVSAGSLIGAFYCYGYSPKEMEEIALKTNFLNYIKPIIPKKAFFSIKSMSKFLKKYIHISDLSQLKIPLYVAVTNLNKGEVEYFNEGDIFTLLRASSSIPVLFEPVEYKKEIYVDGGLMNNLPVEPIKDKVDITIAVEVNPFNKSNGDNIISISIKSFYLAIRSNVLLRKNLCDIFIQPEDLAKIPIFATWKSKEAIDIGYKSVINKAKEIEKLIV